MKIRIQTPAFITYKSSSDKIFIPVSLYDDMEFEKLDERKIKIIKESGYTIPTNDENIVYKAAIALQALKPNKLGARISIKKNIPSFSGLSCQPGNATGTLIALNRLWRFDLNENELMKISKKISPAVAGIFKTYFKPVDGKMKNIILIRPKYIKIDVNWVNKQIGKKISDCSLEDVILSHFPDIREMLGVIKDSGIKTCGISGFGPILFGISEKPIQTKKIKESLKDKIDFIWYGKSCNKWGKLLM